MKQSRPDRSAQNSFKIGDLDVGDGALPIIIAEIAQAHDGSLGTAHAYIDAVADAGADAIKFQTHIAEAESTLDEPFRIRFSRQDSTRFAYWKRMEFTPSQWRGLALHARRRNLIFLSSAFSVEAVGLLDSIGVLAWKVGSGEFRSRDLLLAMCSTQKPILVSTGMSTWAEIHAVAKLVRSKKCPLALFQCTSRYPTPMEAVGLNVLDSMQERFRCPVGLSDHSGTIWPGLAALARKASMLEIHVTFDRRMFGPDVCASVTLDELRTLVLARSAFHRMDDNPVDKNAVAQSLSHTRALFSKSLAVRRRLGSGTVVKADDLVCRKPGTGIPPSELKRIVGRRLRRPATPDRLLRWEDFCNE